MFISIHALREESDSVVNLLRATERDFNPRSPWGERPAISHFWHCLFKFQSTLSVRRATLNNAKTTLNGMISIHALREESDLRQYLNLLLLFLFQSTLSVRRATLFGHNVTDIDLDFNPRSPWGERLDIAFVNTSLADISIHALREESDVQL